MLFHSCDDQYKVSVSGELKTWHCVTLDIKGVYASEQSMPNPFLDYRLEAVFKNGDAVYKVPGYFAADGDASETGANSGDVWKIHFAPDRPGEWSYEISFLKGKNIAVAGEDAPGEPLPNDGYRGTFTVLDTDKSGRDFRSKGRLVYTGSRYLSHAGSGEIFVKGGADSPENFLAYVDFDGTYYGGSNVQRSGEDAPNAGLHSYAPHLADWKEGDPTWADGRGKGMIGALNYLASEEMNSVYFLTLNILGDGEDVWPYTARNERYRFDCSKLDQWEVVFSHMDRIGLMMHVILQETENEHMLDAGYLDVQRKLYLRELVARFSHHNALIWNLGEEHGPVGWMGYSQTVEDTKKMAEYIRQTDPYDHPINMHTHPNAGNRSEYLPEYLGFDALEGPSIQAGNPYDSHASTLKWINRSKQAGKPWFVCIDEIGQHWKGALPDAVDPAHDTIRKHVLWANLMAGGAGVEWYFGYKYAHADLNCEDWRSRDLLWDQTRYALAFFHRFLRPEEMRSMDELVGENAWCFAKPGEVYVIYYQGEGASTIDLSGVNGKFSVQWYNPREGGDLASGSKQVVIGGRKVAPGLPPGGDYTEDWVCLLTKSV